MEAISRLVCDEQAPLVTLTGPGGVGKTRLALQVAADISEEFEGDIRFVSLATIRDSGLVVPAIAQAAGLVALSGRTPKEGLQHFLADRRYLLVLDNFEQIVAAAPEIGELIDSCPKLQVVVTSRESLRIANEQEFPVRPLGLPEHTDHLNSSAVISDATTLFIQRARSVQPDLAMTSDTAMAIAEICIRLDGLPLAIELAAARTKLMSPTAVLTRLVDRFTILSRDARDVPARLRTMRDAVGWSYDLLPDDERTLFRLLSVFPAGFTIEAAEAVARPRNGDGDAEKTPSSPGNKAGYTMGPSLLDAIASLVDKSLLIQTDHSSDHPRFGMLETIRAFGLEQLEAHGEGESCRKAMTEWIVEITDPAFSEQFGPRQRYWTGLLEAEHDNLRAALRWVIDRGDAETASRLIKSALLFWHVSGRFAEGRSWAEEALAIQDDSHSPASRSTCFLAASWLAFYEGDVDYAIEAIDRCVFESEASGDDLLIALAYHAKSQAVEVQGRFDEAIVLIDKAVIHHLRVRGHRIWYPHALNTLGHAEYERGDIVAATGHFESALAEFRSLGNTYGEGLVLTNLAKIARSNGNFDRAVALFQDSLRLRWDHMDRLGIVGCLRGMATTHALAGRFATAARLYGASDGLRESIGATVPRHETRYLQTVAIVQEQLGNRVYQEAWNAGRAIPLEQCVAEALHEPSSLIQTSTDTADAKKSLDLTPREREVLMLICEGRSNREIGEQLFISERTAQTHVQHILDKFDVSTRAAAAAAATKLGMV